MYTLPESLKSEIDSFTHQITDFKNGQIEPVKFKAIRVPMGIYEQRENGTYMVRVRCAAGMITPHQLLEVAKLAQQEGTNPVHLTTRQELQLHNVKLEQLPEILSRLYQLGLSSRGGGGNTVRNIMASEDAGISASEPFDVTPYAVALTNALIAEPDSWSLPRKYKIAFSGSSADNAHSMFNDLGFIATLKNGEKGFKVYFGGGLGSKPAAGHLLFEFLPAYDIIYVAEAVKRLFSEHGNRRNRHKARIRYIFYKLGKEKVFELFNDYFIQVKNEANHDLVLPEMPVPVNSGSKSDESLSSHAYSLWLNRYVKKQRQENLFAVEIPFENGITTAEKLAELGSFLLPFGNDCLRLTMRQNILLRNIPGKDLPSVYKKLKAIDIEADVPHILNSLVACTGADTCRLGLCLSKGASEAIKSTLTKFNEKVLDQLSGFRINLSGCPNSCGQHNLAQLGFYGKVSRNDRLYPAYYVTVGGQTGAGAKLGEKTGEINAYDLPVFVADVLTAFSKSKQSSNDFNSFLHNGGKEKISELLKKYEKVPSFEEDKNYYFDWGADTPFSVKGKGAGECSAGMFDMIDFDKDAIFSLQEQLKQEGVKGNSDEQLYGIVFHSARMLLVTRGIEPKSREEVFTSFIETFIKEGYVDKRFMRVVDLALKNQKEKLAENFTAVNDLALSVIELYNNMDDSLQFKKEPNVSSEVKQTTVQKATKAKDLRGVGCPMNFVKVKIELAQMKSGEILEVLLDEGAPFANVPVSVRSEGHKILKEEKETGYWKVFIEKS